MPDWGNRQAVIYRNFIAPENGYIYVYADASRALHGYSANVILNGITYRLGHNYYGGDGVFLPVSKNDTIETYNIYNDGEIYFIPFK